MKPCTRDASVIQMAVMLLRQRIGGGGDVVDIIIERDDVSRRTAGAGVEDDARRSRGGDGKAKREDR